MWRQVLFSSCGKTSFKMHKSCCHNVPHVARPVHASVKSEGKAVERLCKSPTFNDLYLFSGLFIFIGPQVLKRPLCYPQARQAFADKNVLSLDCALALRQHEAVLANSPYPRALDVAFAAPADLCFYSTTRQRSQNANSRVRQEVNVAIVRLLEGLGLEIAYPTRTLYVRSSPRSQLPVESRESNESRSS